jgi:tetratricopeptide (TPR) repeat protein
MNSRISNYDLVWFDDFNLLRQYVSTNPPRSRLIRYERLPQPRPSTYVTCYLREAFEEVDISMAGYDRAIKNNPNDAYAYYNRAVLKQERLNDLPGAAQDFNIAVALDPYLELSLQSRGSLGDRAGIDPSKYTLVSFLTGNSVTWVNYEKYHYVMAAADDLESPSMLNMFQSYARSTARV